MLAWELGVALAGSLTFIALYGWRSDWSATPVGRNLMAWAALSTLEVALLLAMALGVRVWPWLFAVLFGALDLVVLRRLWLLIQAQRQR